VVAARLRAEAPLTVTTLLAPFEAGASGIAAVPELAARNLPFFRPHAASGRGALAIGVARGRREDVAVVSLDGSEVQVGSWRTRGELCWARFVDGDLRRLLAVDADRFVCRGEERLGGAREIAWREFDVRRSSVLDADFREELLGVRHRGSA
jgi:hypothetical protein